MGRRVRVPGSGMRLPFEKNTARHFMRMSYFVHQSRKADGLREKKSAGLLNKLRSAFQQVRRKWDKGWNSIV
jgi:hypothetical protein